MSTSSYLAAKYINTYYKEAALLTIDILSHTVKGKWLSNFMIVYLYLAELSRQSSVLSFKGHETMDQLFLVSQFTTQALIGLLSLHQLQNIHFIKSILVIPIPTKLMKL